MLYFMTILTIFLFLSIAVIILFKKVINFRQQGKNLQEKESEFIHKLVSGGKMKPDQAFQMDGFIENYYADKRAFKMEKTDNEPNIDEIHTVILEKINALSKEKLEQLLKYLDDEEFSEKRKYNRKDFIRIVDYTVGDRYYRDFIKDMSEGGIFIETSNEFSLGQKILMTFVSPDYQRPFKISGEIIHAQAGGIGVKFKIESQVQESVLKSYVNMIQN